MTMAARHRYSFRDYLDVEEMSTVKHEYLEGDIYAMAGGTPEHSALAAAIITLLANRLRGGPCRVYTSDLRVRVLATGLATYPDAAVVCGPVERDPASTTHVVNPALLLEVLSPTTEHYDRGEKREHYQQIDSLREYVLVAQGARHVEVWTRTATGWSHAEHGAGESIELVSLGISVTVDEIYAEAGLDHLPSG
jgi:Uma2 family endonuclease